MYTPEFLKWHRRKQAREQADPGRGPGTRGKIIPARSLIFPKRVIQFKRADFTILL